MSANAHIAVMRNPFSTAVPTAKVPDGRSPTSLSIRHNVTDAITVVDGTAHIILCPFYSCPLQILSDHVIPLAPNAAPNTPTNHEKKWSYYHGPTEFLYRHHATPSVYQKVVYSNTPEPSVVQVPDIAFSDITRQVPNGPDRCRIVSSGVRVTAINNAELNAGWFEAIRCKSSYDVSDFVALSYSNNISFAPGSYLEANLYKQEWSNCPGYITGKLRDLQKHMFYLQCTGDREFLRTPEKTTFPSNPQVQTATDHHYVTIPADQVADTSYDCILIRVHCPSASSASPNLHGRLLVHAVQNLEVIYSSQSSFKKFETRCLSASNYVKKVTETINRDPKPSVLRLTNA